MNYSPLRYPGGKKKLSAFIAKICVDNNVYLGRWKLIGGQNQGVHRDERHDYRVEQGDLRQLPAEPADSVIILGAVKFGRYLLEFVPPPLNGVIKRGAISFRPSSPVIIPIKNAPINRTPNAHKYLFQVIFS